MVDAVMASPKGTNCKEDVDKFLLSLSSLHQDSASSVAVQPVIQESQAPVIFDIAMLPASVRSLLDVCSFDLPLEAHNSNNTNIQDSNVLAYIAGYGAHKLMDKCCSQCSTKLVGTFSKNNPDHQLLLKKSYEGAVRGLVCPSQVLCDLVTNFEHIYRAHIERFIVSKSIKMELITVLDKDLDVSWLHCSKCHVSKSMLYLLLNVRLHHTLKLANRKLRESKRTKNNKILQFSHL